MHYLSQTIHLLSSLWFPLSPGLRLNCWLCPNHTFDPSGKRQHPLNWERKRKLCTWYPLPTTSVSLLNLKNERFTGYLLQKSWLCKVTIFGHSNHCNLLPPCSFPLHDWRSLSQICRGSGWQFCWMLVDDKYLLLLAAGFCLNLVDGVESFSFCLGLLFSGGGWLIGVGVAHLLLKSFTFTFNLKVLIVTVSKDFRHWSCFLLWPFLFFPAWVLCDGAYY